MRRGLRVSTSLEENGRNIGIGSGIALSSSFRDKVGSDKLLYQPTSVQREGRIKGCFYSAARESACPVTLLCSTIIMKTAPTVAALRYNTDYL
ncbi:hypothetical protein EB796_024546 [Bugula neritina]|uniref:Uncharacterized protein n=1 Tax=Bugula neritina TaxID=10212 RepID=A0A7J7IUS9_BUGNE|nr:hypothetical protein EB796_024546 [Bugula neritina]